MAEAIFKHKVAMRELDSQFEIDSCGTSDYHVGQDPDERTIENAAQNGVPISHKARQLRRSDLEYYDLLLAMDENNLSNILRLAEHEEHRLKIRLMRHYDNENPGAEVPDPYFGGRRGFQDVFDILERSCENLLDNLMKKS